VEYSRKQVIDLLRRAGFGDSADAAMVELSDPVNLEQVQEWGMQRGITRDLLEDRMGGSP
jgi:hypothetical protein